VSLTVKELHMRRRILAAAGLSGAALAAFLATRNPIEAQGPGGRSGDGPAPKLPIKKVVLFSSGVGFFQRDGDVDGEAKIDLTFPAGDINDLLKSLTVQDLGGGQVQAVGYDSRDPVERTLRSFAIDLANNPGLAQILDQARGEKVELGGTTASTTGSIVGVETKTLMDKDGKPIKIEHINILTNDGLRSMRLSDVTNIKFLNPTLDGEFRKALETLALSKDTRKKAVSIRFTGAGKRNVRVSYVTESPVWKTSYRLVLDKEGKPFLQGWAVVENPSDEDWSDVRMSLVSGRPISFRMDLYTPLYVPRPLVEPELFASLRPPTYDGSMEKGKAPMMGGLGGGGGMAPGAPAPPTSATIARNRAGRPADAAAEVKEAERSIAYGLATGNALGRMSMAEDLGLQLGQGVTSAAQGVQLGDFFQYVMESPVTVARQKSALIPIVNKEIEGNRVSIYNARTHVKFPLLGLKFKNATGLSLMQGPVTVFDGPSYAGDARLPDMQADEERLISFAIDLGTEVETKSQPGSTRIVTCKIDKGIMILTEKERQSLTYHAVNRSKTDRTLLVEHPYRPEYKLTSEMKPADRSRDMYRFEVKLPAGQSADVPVTEERDIQQRIAITNLDSQQIRFYLQQQSISQKVKDALAEALKLQNQLQQTRAAMAQIEKQLDEINRDQERLRKNLKEMPPTAAAYKRYLDKFDAQESQIEKLQAEQKRLMETEASQRKAYDTFLSNLTVE
jgi:hypothetical protein